MGRRNRAGGGGRDARCRRPVRAARQRECGARPLRRRNARATLDVAGEGVRAAAHPRSNVQTLMRSAFGCSGVRVFGCSGVRVFGCSGVRVFGCSGVRVFGCSGVRARGADAGGQRSVRQASVSGPSTHGRPIVAGRGAFRHCGPPPRASHGPARTGGTPRAPCRHRRDARRTIQVHDSRAARAAAACCRSFLRTFLARLFCR